MVWQGCVALAEARTPRGSLLSPSPRGARTDVIYPVTTVLLPVPFKTWPAPGTGTEYATPYPVVVFPAVTKDADGARSLTVNLVDTTDLIPLT